MKNGIRPTLELAFLALLAQLALAGESLASPPLPPGSTPSVPVGGPGVTVATTVAVMAYGFWKSRR